MLPLNHLHFWWLTARMQAWCCQRRGGGRWQRCSGEGADTTWGAAH
ncbi:hypothetical protein F383_28904 [Gossypium arboreum]|uniref:Uncharacterized protein n=1 Tax=Gossypium arboreum TaxID=29729 RepID=A0A0B0PFE4_GOSAR|nr:hypothetical protein F383_28904 [Gossypium arboreum]